VSAHGDEKQEKKEVGVVLGMHIAHGQQISNYNNSIISAIIISNYYKLLHISTYLPKGTLPFQQLIP
jgi:hypothetical protein